MTPAVIEPATFRFLPHALTTAVPPVIYVLSFIQEFQSYFVQCSVPVFREVTSAVTIKLQLFRIHEFNKGIIAIPKMSEELITSTTVWNFSVLKFLYDKSCLAS